MEATRERAAHAADRRRKGRASEARRAGSVTSLGRARACGGETTHMRLLISTCFSLRSYSARISCFFASTMRSFSMLNSSSVFNLISAAFSLASCWMKWTICNPRRQ